MDDNKKILIITGGSIDEVTFKKSIKTEKYEYIISVDMGLVIADKLNLPSDYILGDFDSISKDVFNKYKDKDMVKIYPNVKDETDTHLAINFTIELAKKHKIGEIHIFGATGSRIDHLLANIYILKQALDSDINAFIIDKNNKIYLKNNSFSIHKSKQYGEFISLIPYSDYAIIRQLKGFKYELKDKTIYKNFSLGISNEIKDNIAYIDLSEGILIVIESKD